MKKLLKDAIKEASKKKGVTYEELAQKNIVSKTYLTDIMKKGKIPRKAVIEKIANYLGFDPHAIREYWVLDIQDKLERYYQLYSDDDLKKIEKEIKPKNVPESYDNGIRFSDREYDGMKEYGWINLKELSDEDSAVVLNVYNSLKKKK
jgi:transcriptional regulator with XRE-family HTH domain